MIPGALILCPAVQSRDPYSDKGEVTSSPVQINGVRLTCKLIAL